MKRFLITIDGPCASGKTTLAENLADAVHASVIHTDDFVIPHARKTIERLSVPGGNCDLERLMEEVILPWKSGRIVRYHRYDCRADCLCSEETLSESSILILEGCYSNLPGIDADMRIFLNTPGKVREARLIERESPEALQRFRERWIPLENAYMKAYGLPDNQCIIWDGKMEELILKIENAVSTEKA